MLKDLRTLYELRKIIPLEHRSSVARLFVARGKFGLVDASGVLWPIFFRPNIRPPQPQSVMKFTSSLFRPDGADANKYQDDGYFLAVESVCEIVASKDSWCNKFIASPIPTDSFFDSVTEPNHTFYFHSPNSQRTAHIEVRNLAIRRIREFFENRGFLNVQTPTLVPSGGVERYIQTFITEYRDFRKNSWKLNLPTSPEFALKKILAEGYNKVYDIAQSFRTEGQLTPVHEPEFSMLEWYRIGANIEDLIDDTKALIVALSRVLPSQIDFEEMQWQKYTITELLQKHAGFGLSDIQETSAFYKRAKKVSVSVQENDDWDTLFSKVMLDCIEPQIAKMDVCIITEFPKQMCALATVPENSLSAQRFELYIRGVEICNGYLELTNFEELKKRMVETVQIRPELMRDPIFEDTIKFGLPPCSGNALGIDRLICSICGIKNISEILAIPFLSQFPSETVAEN